MTVDEARRAMVAFLDQFISRGAAADVIGFRDRLRDDPNAVKEISRQLDGTEVTPTTAFDAMRRILQAEPWVHGNGKPNVVELQSWTEWDPAGGTWDPAQWHDWLGAIATVDDGSGETH